MSALAFPPIAVSPEIVYPDYSPDSTLLPAVTGGFSHANFPSAKEGAALTSLNPYATAVMSVYAWMRHIRSWPAERVHAVLAESGPHLPAEYRRALMDERDYRRDSPSSRGGGNSWRE